MEWFSNIVTSENSHKKGTAFCHIFLENTANSIGDSRPAAVEKLQKVPSWSVVQWRGTTLSVS